MTNFSRLLFRILFPFGYLYGIGMKLRENLYKRNIINSSAIKLPVISVGNITVGGTGKTPFTIYLAELLLRHGYNPAIVSRGYKGRADAPVNVVSDGKTLLLDSADSGDEPRLMAEVLKTVPVITGKKRIFPCRYVEENFNCDVILLDDGFQHLSLQREFDFVLFNGANLNNLNVLPAGVLREPLSSLKRCDAVVVTNTNMGEKEKIAQLKKKIKKLHPAISFFFTNYIPYELVDCEGKSKELDSLPQLIFGFCGIANPHRFEKSLRQVNRNVTGLHYYADHFSYTQKHLSILENKARSNGAECLVTTEKDLVKVKNLDQSMPLFALRLKVEAEDGLSQFVLQNLKKHPQPQSLTR